MDRLYGTVADASGAAVITVRPTGSVGWIITQVSPEMAVGSAAAVSVSATGVIRKNGALVAPIVPQGDAVGGVPYLELQPADEMTVEWEGAEPGNICKATVFWEVQG